MKRYAIVAITAALAGCQSFTWIRPATTFSDFAADRYACVQESRTGYSAGGSGYAGLGLIIGSAIGAGVQAQSLFNLCMEARGYTKAVPQEVAMPTPGGLPTGYHVAPPEPAQVAYDAPAAFAAAPEIKGEAKYQITAERLVKAHGGCTPPLVRMTAQGFGLESFAISCPDGKTLSVNCELGACQILR